MRSLRMKGASSKRCGILEAFSIPSKGYISFTQESKTVFSASRNCDFRVFVLSIFLVLFSRYLDHLVIVRRRWREVERKILGLRKLSRYL
jgi:hypothetical protein